MHFSGFTLLHLFQEYPVCKSIFIYLFLLSCRSHAELLIYDWSSYGDVEVVVEDIERIDFDDFGKYDPKMKDWRLPNEWDWNNARIK